MAASSPGKEDLADAEWRVRREERLRDPFGWLSITALHWLPEGETRIDELAGTFLREGSRVFFVPEPGAPPALVINGERASKRIEVRPDRDDGKGDRIEAGGVRVEVIERTAGLGVRLRDPASERRANFPGLGWYPLRAEWRVRARWNPAPGGAEVGIENILGGTERWQPAGDAVFPHQGRERRLLGLVSGHQALFIFKDRTNGRTTYGPGRFLYAAIPAPREPIELNFNRAYHPPCAFNPFTTCPLAPPRNRLDFEIEAGEKFKYSE